MSVKDILEIEKRNENNLYEIHLYLEGIFWKAYEWSAYLSRKFPSSLDENNRLKVIKKSPKGYENGYVLVGLQLPSFKKYFPNIINDKEIFEMTDKHIIIHAKQFFKNEDFSNYNEILVSWKNNINCNTKVKNSNKQNNENLIDINSFLNEIISYPIENKNLIDNVLFLGNIKNKAIKLIGK